MTKKRSLFSLLLLAALSTLILSACASTTSSTDSTTGKSDSTAKKPIIVKLSHCTSVESPKGLASQYFADLVNERSEGRIEVQVFPSSQLYGDAEEVQAVLANNAQIIVPSITKLVSMDPSFQVVDLPFLFKSTKGAYLFWQTDAAQALLHKLEPKNLVGMAAWSGAPINIIGRKVYKSADDIKGEKIRVPAGEVTNDVLAALGASGTTVAFSELYTSMQQGLVDGCLSSINNFDTEKIYEVAKGLTYLDMQQIAYIPLTNTTFWNSLAAEDQQLLTECMNEATEYEWQLVDQKQEASLQVLKDAKVEVYQFTEADKENWLNTYFSGVYEKWVPIIGEDLVNAAKESNEQAAQ